MYYDSLTVSEKEVLEKKGVTPEAFEHDCISGELYQRFIDSITQKNGEIEYPKYYGGAYADENRDLVILITEKNDSILTDLTQRIGERSYRTKEVKIPYLTLRNTLDTLIRYKNSNKGSPVAENIRVMCINVVNNSVDVYLRSTADDAVLSLRNTINANGGSSEAINPCKCKAEGGTAQASLLCGQRLYMNSSGSNTNSPMYGSLAFRAKVSNVPGVITAEHVCPETLPVYSSSGQLIGNSTSAKHETTADVSFIQTESGFTPTNTVFDGVSLGLTLHTPLVGNFIFFYGGASGSTGGDLYLEYLTWSDYETGFIYSMYAADYSSAKGDSGGLAYRNIGGTRFACGVHHGTGKIPWDSSDPRAGDVLATFTLATTACSKLNATRY